MRRVAVKENMIITNILCQGWREVWYLVQLVVISDVNKPEQIVPLVGCQCQTIVDRIHCRNIFHAGNLSLLSIAEEVDHETLRQSFYVSEAEIFFVKLDWFKWIFHERRNLTNQNRVFTRPKINMKHDTHPRQMKLVTELLSYWLLCSVNPSNACSLIERRILWSAAAHRLTFRRLFHTFLPSSERCACFTAMIILFFVSDYGQ